jgi:hypothetical protein
VDQEGWSVRGHAYTTSLVISDPIQSSASMLRDNHEKALAVGDPELACFSTICSIGFGGMFCGDNLLEKEQEYKVVAEVVVSTTACADFFLLTLLPQCYPHLSSLFRISTIKCLWVGFL